MVDGQSIAFIVLRMIAASSVSMMIDIT